jgi:hypothetical protein
MNNNNSLISDNIILRDPYNTIYRNPYNESSRNPYNAITKNSYTSMIKSKYKSPKNKVVTRNSRSKSHFIKKSKDSNNSIICAINENVVKIISILSHGETGSGATVYLVEELANEKRRFIIKAIPLVDKYAYNNNSFKEEIKKIINSEFLIYNTIMTSLVKENITPYVIIGNGKVNCDEQEKIFLINETSNDISTLETLSLKNFITKYAKNMNKLIMLHILFQIVYTLLCFNRIKLQHCDLHINNILVFLRHNNIFNENWHNDSSGYDFKYGKSKYDSFDLLDIGIDIRIYDFDHSIKEGTNTNYASFNIESYPEKRKPKLLSNQDLFNVIYGLYGLIENIFKNTKLVNLLECLFVLQDFTNTKEINNTITETVTNTNDYKNFRELFYNFYNTSTYDTLHTKYKNHHDNSNSGKANSLNKQSNYNSASNSASKSASNSSSINRSSLNNNSLGKKIRNNKIKTQKNNRFGSNNLNQKQINDKLIQIIKERRNLLYRGQIINNLGKRLYVFFNKHFTDDYSYFNEYVKSILTFLQDIAIALKDLPIYKVYSKSENQNGRTLKVIDSFDLTKIYTNTLLSSVHLFR